jgi:hypothetical protein
MVEQGKRNRGWHQRYVGARVNCESAPCLPAAAVAWVLDDPRQVPYLMVWKDQGSEKLIEAVRVCAYSRADSLDWTGWVEVKRSDGSHVLIRTIERPLPRNGGKTRFVVCPLCQKARRALYGWRVNRRRTNSVFLTSWECRECTGLRYASEGGALRLRPLPVVLEGRLFAIRENAPRPERCWPYVFVNPLDVKSIL